MNLSHLQYADDMVLTSINALSRVKDAPDVLSFLLRSWGCNMESMLINYLGMKVGVNHKSHAAWSSLIQKIKKRLAT
ncbi:hypothetical protein ACS0TY_035236 [Phlomoides rotata]